MYKNLTPEEIAGLAMYNYIINKNMAEIILGKMHAINSLERISYEDHKDNKIREIYGRELYLRGQFVGYFQNTYVYNENEKPQITYNREENATIEDLRNFLIDADYEEILLIAKEAGLIEEIRNQEKKLSLKK